MAYNIVVGITSQGEGTIDRVEQGLDGVSQAAGRATTALKGLGDGAAQGMAKAEDSLESYRRELDAKWDAINAKKFDDENLKRINAPMEEFKTHLASIDRLLTDGRISMEQYDAQLGRLNQDLEKSQSGLLSEELKAQAALFDRVTAPLRRYEQDMDGLDALLKKEEISLEQYGAALAKVQQQAERGGALAPMQGPAFDPNQAGRGVSDELKREQDLLEKINAPMREYQAQLKALDALLAKDTIGLEQYDRELARVQKRAESAGALAPVQGPKQQTQTVTKPAPGQPANENGIGDVLNAVAPQFGQGGQLLSQFASGGLVAAAGAAALVLELGHLGDEYTTLSNKVERFATDSQSADDILHQQLDLSKELHSNLEATEELYVRVRESTYQLNMSQKQQLELAHDLGVELAAQGHGAEEAATLVRRLGLAFETGSISGRELRSIFKQFPEIGQELADALGHTQAQMLQMANKGQLSAQELVDAFHKIAPEAEKTVNNLHETFSTKFGHLWDEINLSVGGAIDKINEADEDQASVVERLYREHLRGVREAKRQLDQELQRNTRSADITTAAASVGVDVGPFNKDMADKITEVRMTARQAGVDIADAFEGAKAKAQLYGTKIDEIREQHSAARIAEDAKRIYDALYGVDDIMDKGFKRWRDMADQVATITKSIERWKSLTPAGVPMSSDQRDLELQLANLKTDQADSQYGKSIVTYAQGLNTARAELEAFGRAQHDGAIAGEAARQKYDQLMTTLNDGRLPEAIKIWEGLNLPVEQALRDFAALNAMFKSGRIDVADYTAELTKITTAYKGGDAAEISLGIARIHQEIERGMLSMSDYDKAVQKLVTDYGKLQTTASGIRYHIAPEGPSGPASLLPNTYKQDVTPGLYDQSTGNELRSIMAQYQTTTGIFAGTSDAAKRLNEQFERATQLADEFVAPSVKYEQRLKAIDGAVGLNEITEEQATATRRRAKDTLNQENEALEAQKGPMEAYAAALRKLKDQLDAGDISQRKYAEGLDKAKETMLEATGAAKTFSGAMQLNWIKMQQDAESFGATVANLAVNDFGKLNDAIVTAANGGAVSWGQMADSMVQDLERVALKMLEIKLIQSSIGLFSSLGGAAAGGGLADTSIGMEGWSGYATGGSFTVGGNGGIDTTPVMFRATRGEQVTITPPGAYPYPSAPSGGGAAAAGGGAAPVIHVHNHYDSSIGVAAITSQAGQQAILNVLRANAGPMRGALGKG